MSRVPEEQLPLRFAPTDFGPDERRQTPATDALPSGKVLAFRQASVRFSSKGQRSQDRLALIDRILTRVSKF